MHFHIGYFKRTSQEPCEAYDFVIFVFKMYIFRIRNRKVPKFICPVLELSEMETALPKGQTSVCVTTMGCNR